MLEESELPPIPDVPEEPEVPDVPEEPDDAAGADDDFALWDLLCFLAFFLVGVVLPVSLEAPALEEAAGSFVLLAPDVPMELPGIAGAEFIVPDAPVPCEPDAPEVLLGLLPDDMPLPEELEPVVPEAPDVSLLDGELPGIAAEEPVEPEVPELPEAPEVPDEPEVP